MFIVERESVAITPFGMYAPYVVQELVLETCNTRFLVECWQTPEGEYRRGELPAWVDAWPRPDVLPDVIEISLDTGSRIERRAVILRLKPPTRR